MVRLGKYEFLLEKTLEQMEPAPWDAHDLERAKQHLGQEFCFAVDPPCDSSAVRDWLNALPPAEVDDLLDRLNADMASESPVSPR